jgi:hypothetical protein
MIVIKTFMRKLREYFLGPLINSNEQLFDLVLHQIWQDALKESKNPLNKCGAMYYSQADEDGITLEILNRIGIEKGTFAEFGVGDGSQNNTLILIAHNWKGFWVGNEELFFKCCDKWTRFGFLKRWVVKENICPIVNEGLSKIGSKAIDVLSFDLDMNDIYFVEELLNNGVNPKLFIVEYNGKFPPPVRWQTVYDSSNQWHGDDYQGASLQSFYDLFSKDDYTLVCCSHSGVNAFFVSNDYIDKFNDIPRKIKDIYYGPRLFFYKTYRHGHKTSPKTVERMLELNEENI